MKYFARITTALLAGCLGTASFADTPNSLPLNRVSMTLSAQQWVTADTAKVTIAVNAALTSTQLAGFQQNLQHQLKQLSPKSHWQVLQFRQTPSASGLQNVSALAQTRMSSNQLGHLVNQTKQMSQQGTTYKIASIDFTPSFNQIQAAKAHLRTVLYKQVKSELANINNLYAPQQFHVYDISFANQSPLPTAMMMNGTTFAKVAGTRTAPTQSLSVSQKITLTAQVQFGNLNQPHH